MIYDIINGVDEDNIMINAYQYIDSTDKYYKEFIHYCFIKDLEELQLDDTTMGYTLKCLSVGIWAFRYRNIYTFKEIITKICLQGGDTDTNAAVAGAIIGTYYGYNKLPPDWIKTLAHKEFLDKHINQFIATLNFK